MNAHLSAERIPHASGSNPDSVHLIRSSNRDAAIEGLQHAVLLCESKPSSGEEPRLRWVLHFRHGCALVPFHLLVRFVDESQLYKDLQGQKDVAVALGRLVDFLRAGPASHWRGDVLDRFCRLLRRGSIARNGEDALGLFWEPTGFCRSGILMKRASAFATWLSRQSAQTLADARNESILAATLIDSLVPRRMHRHRGSRRAMHIRARHAALGFRSASAPQGGDIFLQRFWERGFHWSGTTPSQALANLRDRMIFVLMRGAGMRLEQALHLYRSDVVEDPSASGVALVRLFHPSLGAAPAGAPAWIDNRARYLDAAFGLSPRNQLDGPLHCAFPPFLVSHPRELFARIHWFPQIWGRVFWQLYARYMQVLATGEQRHPYLFCDCSSAANTPLTPAGFHSSYVLALTRMGLRPAHALRVDPHAHRHAYVNALIRAGVTPRIIQCAMHHAPADCEFAVARVPTSDIRAVLTRVDPGLPFDPFAALSLSAPDLGGQRDE